MKILYKFPTRGRPLKFFRVLDFYVNMMTGNDYEFVITMDNDDQLMNNDAVRKKLDEYAKLKYFYGDSKTKIEAVNADMQGHDFDILFLVSDDMIPEVKGYDDVVRQRMLENFPDTDGILWFHDGYRDDINTLSIMGKKYYDRFGYIYHPSYKSFWCDNEFTEVGNILKRQLKFGEVIIRHLNPEIVLKMKETADKFAALFPEYAAQNNPGIDETWIKNNIHVDQDVYTHRKSNNFDL